jgi:hypothetical protein
VADSAFASLLREQNVVFINCHSVATFEILSSCSDARAKTYALVTPLASRSLTPA